jgi:hypothetical protein
MSVRERRQQHASLQIHDLDLILCHALTITAGTDMTDAFALGEQSFSLWVAPNHTAVE